MIYNKRMRYFLILLTFIVSFIPFAHVAHAQGAFSTEEKQEQSIDEQLGLTKPKNERESSGDIRKDIALRYYDDCNKYKEGVLSAAEQDMFCSCISNGIDLGLSTEEAKLLYDESRKGQRARDKMMLEIYAPCMKFPIRDTVINTCRTSKAMDGYPQKKTLCECQANMLTQHVGIISENLVQGALQSEKWYKDPIGNYLQSQDFRSSADGYLQRCIQIFVYGWE